MTGGLWVFLLSLATAATSGTSQPKEEEFDRLDGRGKSGVRVDVIEWEGNLEVHVYPAGALAGLALKLDKKNKEKPVMVIGYRFRGNAKEQLIRRAILGIPMMEGFKTYKDPSSGSEYDKFVISNQTQSGQMVAYRLDPEPTQLYPEGHPALAQKKDAGAEATREPAAQNETSRAGAPESNIGDQDFEEKDGSIKPFRW